MNKKRLLSIAVTVIILLLAVWAARAGVLNGAAGTAGTDSVTQETQEPFASLDEEEPSLDAEQEPTLNEAGSYTTKDDVALYLYLYGRLPDNFITKSEARELGWDGGGLERYAPGKCIGGDRFGNYEGLLPERSGRSYTECDINTLGAAARGAERIVFSNDGLIYYTADHYETFTLLYGEEDA